MARSTPPRRPPLIRPVEPLFLFDDAAAGAAVGARPLLRLAGAVATALGALAVFGGLALTAPLAAAASTPAPSSGQVFKQGAPPSPLPTPPKTPLPLPLPTTQGNTHGAATRIQVKTLTLSGNHTLATAILRPAVQPLIGRTTTLEALHRAARAITGIYQQHGYPLAYAYVPAQTVRGGHVRIAIVEPRFDKIDITGTSRFKPAQARRVLGIHTGDPVRGPALQHGLLRLNRTPGLQVDGTLVPGAQTGTTRLKAQLRDRPLVSATVGGDNYGSDFTGRLRSTANVRIADPFGYGSQFAVNGVTTESGLLHSGGGSFVSPDLWRGLRVGAYGSYTDYELGQQFARLGQHGVATRTGADVQYPLILQPAALLDVRLDYIHDHFEQDIESVGIDEQSYIDLVKASLDGAYGDTFGGTDSGSVSLEYGHLAFDSADARRADRLGPGAGGDFWVGQFQLGRTQALPHRLNLHLTLRAQLASPNLDASQKLYLGGPYGVMAYSVGDAGGDNGILFRSRLDRAFPLPHGLGIATPGLLAQAGAVTVNHDDYTRRDNHLQRFGLGAGLRYRWHETISARVAYAYRVGTDTAASQPGDNGELYGRIQIHFR